MGGGECNWCIKAKEFKIKLISVHTPPFCSQASSEPVPSCLKTRDMVKCCLRERSCAARIQHVLLKN